jgi:N-acetylated-alpha-linked acidic dipeptidase
MRRHLLSLALLVLLGVIGSGLPTGAQAPGLRGFPDDAVAAERQREEQFRKVPDAARLKEYMEAIAGEPHVAGQPSSKRVADYALAKFKSWGLDAQIEEFEAMMPWPLETSVELVAPEKYALKIKEPVLPEDPDSGDQTPLYNAYSGDGDVTGDVVYVNYGMPADFEKLKELGISVKGKIVLARYGAGCRV